MLYIVIHGLKAVAIHKGRGISRRLCQFMKVAVQLPGILTPGLMNLYVLALAKLY